MTAVQALQGIHLLKDLDAATLSVVGAAASTHTFDAGQDICREGQAADGLYLIRTGSVRVTKSGSDADVVILGSGSHFGELGLVDEAPHSATVTASERCEMIKISTTTLRDKLAANPVAAAAFYRAVAHRSPSGCASRPTIWRSRVSLLLSNIATDSQRDRKKTALHGHCRSNAE